MKGLLVIALALLPAVSLWAKTELAETTMDALGSFEYSPEAPDGENMVVKDNKKYLKSILPEEVFELNKKSISITGYMLPLDSQGHMVREFLLVPDTQACCFGIMPGPNQFIYVQMSGQGALVMDNIPVKVTGRLTIAETWDQGFFSHLYHIRGQRVEIGKFQ
ncbi:MAG: DUF3299 domain-containing protein [Verrucomicrobiota bacterium]